MIIHNGYSIEQYPNENKVVIHFPQTMETLTDTISPVSRTRKKELEIGEMVTILAEIEACMEAKND